MDHSPGQGMMAGGKPDAAPRSAEETGRRRAAQHPSVSLIDLQRGDDDSLTAAFSLPTGGQRCLLTTEGDGILAAPAVFRVDGFALASQTVQVGNRWTALVTLPLRRTWWLPLTCEVSVPGADERPYTVTMRLHGVTQQNSLVETDLLPARRAELHVPEQDDLLGSALDTRIDALLASGEVSEAAGLLTSAIALGLGDVSRRCGPRVLKAIADQSEFLVSTDALKLLIALSS